MEFDIVKELMGITLFGAEWVLWLLMALSVLSFALILERTIYFFRSRLSFSSFILELGDLLSKKEYEKAEALCKEKSTFETDVALTGLQNRSRGFQAMEGSMMGYMIGYKSKLDRGLVILGTLGNNAPFIGLFGTVIGIIKAFHDLSAHPDGGPSVVMAGISESLVATAVGLMVAIPAVIAFNAFTRLVKTKLSNAQAISQTILTYQ
jgi:biopolymer transport protein ExbB/TolQ